MAIAGTNGVRFFYKLGGGGDVPLVLVHGSWSSHHEWDLVFRRWIRAFRVLSYDRRGHGESTQPLRQGSVREDVADLAALIERLGLAPAWVLGNSFGASITLRLAGERPDLFRGLVAHEPPLFALLADDPHAVPMFEQVERSIAGVVEQIASGDHAGAAERFVDTVALGPGAWARLSRRFQQTLIDNAPTFLDEAKDPEQTVFELDCIKRFSRPVLLTTGEESPPIFGPVVGKLAEAMPHAEVMTLSGAGHIPHVTHPSVYARAVAAFIRKHAA